MSNIYFPESLKIGKSIGITALSSGKTDEEDMIILNSLTKRLQNDGYNLIVTDNVRKNKKLVSSSPNERINEFMSLWTNDDVSYIISCGGEFLMEVLPYIDEKLIKSSTPKWIQGYSDVSLFNFYITTNYNIATIHSYSFSVYGKEHYDESIKLMYKFATNSEIMLEESFSQKSFDKYSISSHSLPGKELELPDLTENVEYKLLNSDNDAEISFSGRLIGGCMDVLKTIIGTKFDNTKNFCNSINEGIIWFLENCEMNIADLKRTLWQMKEARWFENTKGFLIGRTSSKADIYDFIYEDALSDTLSELNVPVVYDVDFGHTFPQWTIINGAKGEFKYKNGKGELIICR